MRITRTTPETLVEWEGDHAAGTVCLEPSGFGTRVVLTSGAPPREPEPPRSPLLARLLRRPPPAPELAAPPEMSDDAAERVLAKCLDALGSARHHPFSRA